MNPSNSLQTEPEIRNDYYHAASAVSPNAHHQNTGACLFTIACIAKPLSSATQTLEDNHFGKIFSECILTTQLSTGHLKYATTKNFGFVHVQFIPNHGGKK